MELWRFPSMPEPRPRRAVLKPIAQRLRAFYQLLRAYSAKDAEQVLKKAEREHVKRRPF